MVCFAQHIPVFLLNSVFVIFLVKTKIDLVLRNIMYKNVLINRVWAV